tara:strand:+ start:33302 stop:34186 length:885 start_codon:yes stop_codon:yes gene_type:complete
MLKDLSLGEKYFKKKNNISVVIPSLGGKALAKTIRYLNNGITKPDKILICVPKSVFPKNLHFKRNTNFELIHCPIKGQVRQKIFGFTKINSKYTFQIDDDILVNKTCLKFLLRGAIIKPNKSAFGAFLKSKKNMVSENMTPSIFKQTMNFFLYGKRRLCMRSVLNSGIATDLFDQRDVFLSKTEWLNGIVFTNTKNLIKFDYFKLNGKAYNEDVIHSGILKKNNVSLWMNNKAVCLEQNQILFNNKEKFSFRYWIKIYKTRKMIISLYKGSFIKMIFLIFLGIFKNFFIKPMKK